MGQRATVSGSAVFADVPADPALVVPYGGAFTVPQQLGARTQLVHAAIQVGIAGGALRDAGWFVREKARPFFEAARAGMAGTGDLFTQWRERRRRAIRPVPALAQRAHPRQPRPRLVEVPPRRELPAE
jgi:alkylation response protein AidB-like acyl-CoA dehydrogenase